MQPRYEVPSVFISFLFFGRENLYNAAVETETNALWHPLWTMKIDHARKASLLLQPHSSTAKALGFETKELAVFHC